MKEEITMPKMGESVTEGTILSWHKKKGERIEEDEILLEISTDKVDTEIPSPAAGVITELKYEEGDTVEVGEVIAVIDSEAEEGASGDDDTKAAEEEAPADQEEADQEEAEQEEAEQDEPEEEEEDGDGDEVIVEMPKMGESVVEGTILTWHKKPGEKIEKDETLLEISTDKVDTEVPSPESGVLTEILVEEQETVEVGTPLAKISLSGKAPKTKKSKTKKTSAKGEKKSQEKETEKESPVETPPSQAEYEVFNKAKDSNKFFSPLVLNIASKEGISFDELNSIKGTGVDGRVSKKDVLRYLDNRPEQGKSQAKPASKSATSSTAKSFTAPKQAAEFKSGEVEEIKMDNIRQKIMAHMVHSRDTAVHVTSVNEVDMTAVERIIKKHKQSFKEENGVNLTYMAFIAYAAIKALRDLPLLNATVEGDTVIRKKYVNLGIAVAMEPNGLIVPNVKDAHEKNITGLAKSIYDVATRARDRKLTPDEISDGTFSITNYGVFGTLMGTPIINTPEVAILGVGKVEKKPVVLTSNGDESIGIRSMMYLSLAHDHRLVDGMLGGLYLQNIKETLETMTEDALA